MTLLHGFKTAAWCCMVLKLLEKEIRSEIFSSFCAIRVITLKVCFPFSVQTHGTCKKKMLLERKEWKVTDLTVPLPLNPN